MDIPDIEVKPGYRAFEKISGYVEIHQNHGHVSHQLVLGSLQTLHTPLVLKRFNPVTLLIFMGNLLSGIQSLLIVRTHLPGYCIRGPGGSRQGTGSVVKSS